MFPKIRKVLSMSTIRASLSIKLTLKFFIESLILSLKPLEMYDLEITVVLAEYLFCVLTISLTMSSVLVVPLNFCSKTIKQ